MLATVLDSAGALAFTVRSRSVKFNRNFSSAAARITTITAAAAAGPFCSPPVLLTTMSLPTHIPIDPEVPQTYPTPLSPPLPAISKQIELSRATSASSRSGTFSLSRGDVIFQDEWLIVVNKPQGVYCEAVLSSIPRLLRTESLDPAGTGVCEMELHLANRLDRDTSGVMVITKSHKVAAKLVKAFTDHKVTKRYIALCVGSLPKWETVTIQSGHGRSKFGAWRVYAASDVGRTLPGGSVVRDMETSFEVLSVNGRVCSRRPTLLSKDQDNLIIAEEKSVVDKKTHEILVRAFPCSGRTHQIRLHCRYLGIPIRGDVKYEGVYEWKGKTYDGHELHAESLSLEHPVTGTPLLFQAPLPSWASQMIQPATITSNVASARIFCQSMKESATNNPDDGQNGMGISVWGGDCII